jgi:CheY-like chemotaxis protein
MVPAHIVLIEDNPADVLLVEMALQESGVYFDLTRYADGEEALEALCSVRGAAQSLRPDVILLDLNTPRSDGFDVLAKLRRTARLSDVPIAILSSSQARSDKNRTRLMGAVCYIEKPSRLDEFLSTVGQAVKDILPAASTDPHRAA